MGAVIDTSWLVAIERRLAIEGRSAAFPSEDPLVSAVTIAELRMGVELADEAHREFRETFVETLVAAATVLPFGVDEALSYGRVAAQLRRTGQRIGERDLMIAATALAHGHSVVTLNRSEFERVPGLLVLDALPPNSP